MSAQGLVSQLDHILRSFDSIVSRHGIEKLKTIGDAYMCASGLPDPSDDHLIDLIDAAWDISAFMSQLNADREIRGEIENALLKACCFPDKFSRFSGIFQRIGL